MWIVQLALRRPYTFVVMALLIAILGVVTIVRMPTDVFPEIDIPVVAAVWQYSGISADEMETRVAGAFERVLVSTVNNIDHIESQSLNGTSVIKVFLTPGGSADAAVAQINAAANVALRAMPPGIFPPLIIKYSASNVPILQASLSSDSLSEQQLFDLAANFFRPAMATVPGAQIPYPYGGKQRQVMVDIDPDQLFALKLSPQDVTNAINTQNLILPGGTAKVGPQEYNVRLNSAPSSIAELNDLPIKTVNGRTIYVHDVAHVRDGFLTQTNIVNVDGHRGVLQPILKSGASTLDIVSGVRNKLPALMATLPKELNLKLIADQSIFVRASIHGVVKEAVIAAGLTGLMILMFLGSWRSTLIVVISIPLSILVSIIVLNLIGQTLNVMTLGGMALAVGILVDDATVEIENIHRNLHMRKPLIQSILDGAQQIAVPAFVSTLCICIVFVPVAFITGAARSLFTPLAMAVVFAMLTSYFLSRTLVPTMVRYLLGAEVDEYVHGEHDSPTGKKKNLIWRFHYAFNRQFEKMRAFYGAALAWTLSRRAVVVGSFILFVAGSCALYPLLGRDFFPSVDSGQIRMHVRAPAGTRLEETERYFARAEDVIRSVIPEHQIETIADNMGVPNSSINLALSDGSQMSSADGEILITLDEHHQPTPQYVQRLRKAMADKLPELTVFIQPPDIVTQVLNFGLAAPIDVQLTGPRRNLSENLKIARKIRDQIVLIPGAVDSHLQQVSETPELHVDVDRTMASEMNLSQKDVANSVLVSLSSSAQVAPNYWLDPKSGVQYALAVQTPQHIVSSAAALAATPIAPGAGAVQDPQLLTNIASIDHGTGPTNVTHNNVAVTYDVHAGVQGRDLGRVSKAIDQLLDQMRPNFPRGTTVSVRGQVQSMNSSFHAMAFGLVFAVVLVYLLMVINFQSWIDPLIILGALPGAMSGIAWGLFVTHTTLSVPALMGAIMSIGVATANSILMITFANDQRAEGRTAHDAAWLAGHTRLRPVVMTALAMIIGMLPMSLGNGEGGEQNAPLGRAVIGGLALATFATLFFVPVVYSLVKSRGDKKSAKQEAPRNHELEISGSVT